MVLGDNPVSEYVVEAVFDIDHVEPPSVDLSISYPVIAEPPLFEGAVQLRLICDDEIAVAVNPVGGDGAVLGGGGGVPGVVSDAVLDGWLVASRVIADTLYV